MKRLIVLIVVVLACFLAALAQAKPVPRHAVRAHSPLACIGAPSGIAPLSVPKRLACGGQISPPACTVYEQGRWWYGNWHTWSNPNYYFTKWWICGYVVYPNGTGFAAWL